MAVRRWVDLARFDGAELLIAAACPPDGRNRLVVRNYVRGDLAAHGFEKAADGLWIGKSDSFKTSDLKTWFPAFDPKRDIREFNAADILIGYEDLDLPDPDEQLEELARRVDSKSALPSMAEQARRIRADVDPGDIAAIIGEFPAASELVAAHRDLRDDDRQRIIAVARLPASPSSRVKAIGRSIASAQKELARHIAQYENIRKQGLQAISNYDILIPYSGNALFALRSSLNFKSSHIAYEMERIQAFEAELPRPRRDHELEKEQLPAAEESGQVDRGGVLLARNGDVLVDEHGEDAWRVEHDVQPDGMFSVMITANRDQLNERKRMVTPDELRERIEKDANFHFETAGRLIYRDTVIYKSATNVAGKVEQLYAVQTEENRARVAAGERPIGGDTLHRTLEDAKIAVDRQIQAAEADAEYQAKEAVRLAAEDAAKDAARAQFEDVDGFANDLSPMNKERALQALNQHVMYNGNVLSRKQLVKQKVADGFYLDQEEGEGQILTNGEISQSAKQLTKTGLDYAAYLIQKRAQRNTLPDEAERETGWPTLANLEDAIRAEASGGPLADAGFSIVKDGNLHVVSFKEKRVAHLANPLTRSGLRAALESQAKSERDAVGVIRELARIRHAEHPSYAGLTDGLANMSDFIWRLAHKDPERAKTLASAWLGRPAVFSAESGFSPERVTALGNEMVRRHQSALEAKDRSNAEQDVAVQEQPRHSWSHLASLLRTELTEDRALGEEIDRNSRGETSPEGATSLLEGPVNEAALRLYTANKIGVADYAEIVEIKFKGPADYAVLLDEILAQRAKDATANGEPTPDGTDAGERMAALAKRVRRFASGMSRTNDFSAGVRAGHGVGVDVGQLSDAAMRELADRAANQQAQVFIDSGAFSLFKRSLKDEYASAMDFDAILAKYDKLQQYIQDANTAEEHLVPTLLVMPDVVGDQAASLGLVSKYRDWIKAEARFSVSRPVVPLQRGDMSLSEVYESVVQTLGTDNFVVGIPSNAAAISPEEFTEFLRTSRPKAIHILGALADSRLNPRLQQIVEAGLDGDIEVSADANVLRSKIVEKGLTAHERASRIENVLSGPALAADYSAMLDTTNKSMPLGFEVRDDGTTLALYRDGVRTDLHGLGRTKAAAEQAQRYANLRADTDAKPSEQFDSYRRHIAHAKASGTLGQMPGLIEQIRGDERLEDGESERLLVLANDTATDDFQLPAEWKEAYAGGMATNLDPIRGGIIDSEIVSGKWFVIFNDDSIANIEGLSSRREAFAAHDAAAVEKQVEESAIRRRAKNPERARERIEDAGEKIGGARKDFYASSLSHADLADMNEREVAELVTKDNVWPSRTIDDYRSAGVDARVALFVQSLRRDFPNKPGMVKHAPAYIALAETLRDATAKLRNREDIGTFRDRLCEAGVVIVEKTGYYSERTSIPDRFSSVLNESMQRAWVFQNRYLYSPDDGFRKARSTYEQKSYRMSDDEWVRPRDLDSDQFYDFLESLKQRTTDKRKKTIENRDGEDSDKAALTRPHLASILRDGLPDERKGKDIGPDDLLADFGFRACEFGNWLPDAERQDVLNRAYDALSTLARTIGVDRKFLSLDGTLALAFGSRGVGRALAHYECARKVINLTRLRGAGSLAHEWWHALDDFVGDKIKEAADEKQQRMMADTYFATELFLARTTGRRGKVSAEVYADEWKLPSGQRELLPLIELSNAIGVRPWSNDEVLRQAQTDLAKAERSLLHTLREILSNIRPDETLEASNAQARKLVDQLRSEAMSGESYLERGQIHPLQRSLADASAVPMSKDTRNRQDFFLQGLSKRIVEYGEAYALVTDDDLRRDCKYAKQRTYTKYASDAKHFDAKKAQPYWSTMRELSARAFESYVQDTLEENGWREDYLVHGTEESAHEARARAVYPLGEDRANIKKAMLTYLELIRSKYHDVSQLSDAAAPALRQRVA